MSISNISNYKEMNIYTRVYAYVWLPQDPLLLPSCTQHVLRSLALSTCLGSPVTSPFLPWLHLGNATYSRRGFSS